MARPLRIKYSGAFYHIFSRGIEKRTLFVEESDYKKFNRIMCAVQERYRFICHSYCWMPNHYHLFVETPEGNLSKFMQELNARYVQYFNWKYDRVGPLFQGRFKAKLVERDAYSLRLSRYIHMNPVKAKLVQDPANWPWSSYRSFILKGSEPSFLQTSWLLNQFRGPSQMFMHYTLEGLNDPWDPLKSNSTIPIIGEKSFVQTMKRRLSSLKDDSSITGVREIKKDQCLEAIDSFIQKLECKENLKRKILIYALKEYTGMSLAEIGNKAGGMKSFSVSKNYKRFLDALKSDRNIYDLVSQLKCQMSSPDPS